MEEKMEKVKVVIPRNRWLRGKSGVLFKTEYCDDTGRVELCGCVLGYLGVACGFQPSELVGRVVPLESDSRWPEWLFVSVGEEYGHRPGTSVAMDINDHHVQIPDAEREQLLKEFFGPRGVDLSFVDSVAP